MPDRVSTLWLRTALGLAGASRLLGWGAGHEDCERAILARLPAELRVAADGAEAAALIVASHYPDGFGPFDPALADPAGIAAFTRAGLRDSRYVMHADKGRAVVFLNLIRCLEAGDRPHARFWIACLGHSTADMVACNHDPLIHVALYGWADPQWNLLTPGGTPWRDAAAAFDLGGPARQPAGAQALAAAIARLTLADDGRELGAAVLGVMRYGYEGAAYCGPRAETIRQAALAGRGPADPAIVAAMSELGAWAVGRVLRDVAAAERLAREGAPVDFDPAWDRTYAAAVATLTQTRTLEQDPLFAPLQGGAAPADRRAIGVLAEPVWRMEESFLGFGQRILARAIASALRADGRPYRLVDARAVMADGLPPPREMPMMIIATQNRVDLRDMTRVKLAAAVQAYVAAGGRVLWIGGNSPGAALPEIAAAIAPPAARDWPFAAADWIGSALQWQGSATPWPVRRTPATAAGWQRPECNVTFRDDPTLRPLLRLSGHSTLLVGVAWPREEPRVAFFPAYALWPHLFTADNHAGDATLDDTGMSLLRNAGNILSPHL